MKEIPFVGQMVKLPHDQGVWQVIEVNQLRLAPGRFILRLVHVANTPISEFCQLMMMRQGYFAAFSSDVEAPGPLFQLAAQSE